MSIFLDSGIHPSAAIVSRIGPAGSRQIGKPLPRLTVFPELPSANRAGRPNDDGSLDRLSLGIGH